MILVDNAIWTWRDRKWAHMVSDTSIQELHDFATSIGKLRIMFQGDHYDVDEDHRALAIEHGASPVDGRDIVKALRSAGLRKRPSDPQINWRRRVQCSVGDTTEMMSALEPVAELPGGDSLLNEVRGITARATLDRGDIEVIALAGPTGLAVVIGAPNEQWTTFPDPTTINAAEAYASSYRGITTVELLSGPGTAR
ncbi:MAG: DUF4031 domain-containing protein [Actinomycetota bacterium]|jgi:hypothetical protein|nr:DUF4031 domain-containing protein [Actinomycetota bacterium]